MSIKSSSLGRFCVLTAVHLAVTQANAAPIGDGPNMTHVEQQEIENGSLSLNDVLLHGRDLFAQDFNSFDGQGDPRRQGVNAVGVATGFNRISGPDSLACTACHSKPFVGGGGDNTAAIFPEFNRPDRIDFLSFEGLNVKNSQSVFGGGPKQRLAEEMSAELQAIATQAQDSAVVSGQAVSLPLTAKGIGFGVITALPDRSLDTSDVEGVASDLQIRPFNSIGSTLDLREFTIGAMEQHFGIEAEERFGIDGDGDGVNRELTVGDVTATALFQAALPVPVQIMPKSREQRRAVKRGRTVFGDIGCDTCHTPQFVIDDPVFREHAPGSAVAVELDLTREGFAPRLPRTRSGRGLIRLYSDMKRHDMGPALAEPVLQTERASTQHFMSIPLWGVASTGPWLHDGRATTLTEAILLHGGEAQAVRDEFDQLPQVQRDQLIEFLKSLQIVVTDPRLL